MKYSVIIPVYQAERTVARCLDSLLSQPHKDAEFLVINDGSSDASGEICREYAAKYACIRYFEKENGGVSSARNLGLDQAAGRYILFVDSDDYVAADYFAAIDSALEENRPDVLLFAIQTVGGGDRIRDTGNYIADDALDVAQKVDAAVRAYLFSSLMNKTFDRDIIEAHGLRFNEELSIGEDQVFIFQYAMHIKKMVSVPRVLYFLVLENEQSLSRKRRDYLAEQLLTVNMDMMDAVDRAGVSQQVRQIYRDAVAWVHYRSAYSACKELLKYDLTRTERRKRIRKICKMYSVARMQPGELKCQVIAYPVIHGMSRVVDGLIIWQHLRRQKKN